jgi:hypothetical protein
MKKLVFFFIIAAAVMGCEESSPLLPEAEQVVVRAYLYANEPVTDIQLTTTYAITSEDTAGVPINDAAVSLEKNGQIYPLVSTPGDSGYYHYAGNDLEVSIGDKFKMVVEYHGEAITGETVIPTPPRNINISADRLVIDTSTLGGFFNDTLSCHPWPASGQAWNDLFCYRAQCLFRNYGFEQMGNQIKVGLQIGPGGRDFPDE